jgi:hypothetical protein
MHNLEIQFNKEVISKIKSLHFQADQIGSILFVLFALYENRFDLLDEFDDYNKQKRAILLYKELEIKGLVTQLVGEAIEGKQTPHFVLQPNGINLVEFIKSEFKKSNNEIKTEDIAIVGVENLKTAISNNVEDWIDEWIDLFPEGVRSGGRLLRSDKPACTRKMRIFLKEYGFDKELVIKATKAYLQTQAEKDYQYTRCAVYFIYRMEGIGTGKTSDLAAWCDDVSRRIDKPKTENNLDILV